MQGTFQVRFWEQTKSPEHRFQHIGAQRTKSITTISVRAVVVVTFLPSLIFNLSFIVNQAIDVNSHSVHIYLQLRGASLLNFVLSSRIFCTLLPPPPFWLLGLFLQPTLITGEATLVKRVAEVATLLIVCIL